MNRLIKLILTISCCIPLFIEAEIYEAESVKDIRYEWDQNSWLLVDLDNCLFEAKQALGHADWFHDLVSKRMNAGMTKDEAIMDAYPLWIRVQEQCEIQPLESEFISLIQYLQSSGITVMGLTHRHPTVVAPTIRQVLSLGVDFTNSAPKVNAPINININGPAVFEQGILFVGDYNRKSEVLLDFFDKIGHTPNRVVFIDDKKTNVDDLDLMLPKYDIEYLGIHYTRIQKIPPIYSKEIADYQEVLLDSINRIISNEAAVELMKEKI